MASCKRTTAGPPSKKLKNERLTPQYRAAEFPNESFRASGDQTFCDYCQTTVDWHRRDMVLDHKTSKKHEKSKARYMESGSKPQQQITLHESFTSKDARNQFIKDLLITITSAGLSLEKVDDFRPFLKKYCSMSGAVPSVDGLCKRHLDKVVKECREALVKIFEKESISVLFDETCDVQDHSVLNILFGKFCFNIYKFYLQLVI